jgi:hypothetical protein
VPWEAIKYVSSGITLVAFLLAIVLAIFRSNLTYRERLISSAPPNDRAKLIKTIAKEYVVVDVDRMSEERAYEIVMEQIRARNRRYLINAGIVLFVCVLSLIAAVIAYIIGLRPIVLGQSDGNKNSPPRVLFQSGEIEKYLRDWKPTPEREPDGAMGITGNELTFWKGVPVDEVQTLEFWIELNDDQESVAWAAAKNPSKNDITVLHMPSGNPEGAKIGTYTLITPGVQLPVSSFSFDRPIAGEQLTVLVVIEPSGQNCILSYTFVFDPPLRAKNRIESDIWLDLLQKQKTQSSCVTLRGGLADRQTCSGPPKIAFSSPANSKLRILKVSVNEKDLIGRRCYENPL